MKSVKRVSAKADKMQKLQRTELPKSEHTTVADKIRTKERQIKREIAIMKKLRHPHVVRLYEIIDDRLREKIYIGAFFFTSFQWHSYRTLRNRRCGGLVCLVDINGYRCSVYLTATLHANRHLLQ
jgi:serine/threonine protein kinase